LRLNHVEYYLEVLLIYFLTLHLYQNFGHFKVYIVYVYDDDWIALDFEPVQCSVSDPVYVLPDRDATLEKTVRIDGFIVNFEQQMNYRYFDFMIL